MEAQFQYKIFQYQYKIEEASISETLAVINELTRASRWKAEQFKEALREASLTTFLIEHSSQIIGFAIFSVVSPEAHLVNIAIAPLHQRTGLGQSLLEFSLQTLKSKGISECWLEVRESNLQAQSFYQKAGFSLVQKRKGFYEEPLEDGLLMVVRI